MVPDDVPPYCEYIGDILLVSYNEEYMYAAKRLSHGWLLGRGGRRGREEKRKKECDENYLLL